MKGRGWKRFHTAAALLWTLTLVPTILWWRQSILWVAFMSVYAIVIGHWSAIHAASAQETIETPDD